MFVRSAKSVVLAVILIAVGGFQLIWGLTYSDAAERETSTVGSLSNVQCGRGCTYTYVFTVNDVKIVDDSNTCKTPLTSRGCKNGAPVRVYYDPEDFSTNLLEEFAAAGRARIFMGVWMLSCGLILIGVNFLLNRKNADPDIQIAPSE